MHRRKEKGESARWREKGSRVSKEVSLFKGKKKMCRRNEPGEKNSGSCASGFVMENEEKGEKAETGGLKSRKVLRTLGDKFWNTLLLFFGIRRLEDPEKRNPKRRADTPIKIWNPGFQNY